VDTRKRDLTGWQGKLEALSPLAVLERGYSLAFRLPGGDLLRDAKQLRLGDEVEVRLRRGRFVSIVEEVDEMKTKDSEEKRNGGTEV